MVTQLWVLREAAFSFVRAHGARKRRLVKSLEDGAMSLYVDVIPSDSVDEMRRRAYRAGRMLADDAQRRRIKVFSEQGPTDGECHQLIDSNMAIAMRISRQWVPAIGQDVYRLDMLGARH